MADAAERGKESTRELVAKVGRASRQGERSRGVLDAGATSCWLMLSAMATSMRGAVGRRRLTAWRPRLACGADAEGRIRAG